MAQVETFTWTNGATAPGSKIVPIGFEVAQVTIYDQTNIGATSGSGFKQAVWLDTMPSSSALLQTASGGSYITSGGVSFLAQAVKTGASLTAATKANPGTLTVDDATMFVVGDVIKAVGIADDATGKTWNGSYTITSIAGNVLTLNVDTSAFAAYVGGGYVSIATRVIDGSAVAWPVTNRSQMGLLLGSSVCGGASEVLHLVAVGKNPVT